MFAEKRANELHSHCVVVAKLKGEGRSSHTQASSLIAACNISKEYYWY